MTKENRTTINNPQFRDSSSKLIFRDSDTVKRVNIGKYIHLEENENPLELPLYIVSLVEHKTKVEYNVTFDFQEEKRKMREAAEYEIQMAKQRAEQRAEQLAEQRAEQLAEQLAEQRTEQLAKQYSEEMQKMEREIKEKVQKELAISRRITKLLRQGCSDMEIRENLIGEFNLSAEQADEACRNAFEN